ncbi:MAG TPA: mannose-6-phosphate isomerase [Candidatus Margulisbacteria bacterium]|nr:MAG: mannose-6-phosphate isomerase [Candidatus Margulisbacteria bacterium GWD2_39_127]HAR62902.1 mannose-6-phosphate isomerase [Candidatus Margulisiibacteriota bacterium]
MSEESQKEYLVSIGERPWGAYYVLENEPDHKVKRIVVKPYQRLSLQRHKKREEHWFILRGEAHVTLNDQQIVLIPTQFIDIPIGSIHRISNNTEYELEFIEIQTGDYFGEDDIERMEDDYSRLDI